MKTITEFPRKVVEFPDMGIVMPDGCRLSARVWMPEDAGDDPVPAILEHLPYRKRDGTTARDCLTHPYLAGHGYACIRVDMRGNGDSQGLMEDEYAEQELQDACDVIAWAASQPWCNGNVGMMGISWGGFNALQVAARQPPALKAIVTLCSTDDRYADDIHYKGGLLLNENLGWGATMLSYSSRPPDPALVGDDWRAMWLERLEDEPFLPAIWLRHQHRDAYWKRGSVCEDFPAIRAATLAVGGWGDAYKNAVGRLVAGITHAPAKGIVGPWIHKYPHFAIPDPAIGFLQEALRWWDRWLKGLPTGVEDDPAMRLYLMESVPPRDWYEERPGRWIVEPQWPAPEIAPTTLRLGAELQRDTAEPQLPTTFASPQDCGMAGGEYCAIWLGPEMPGDQRGDDALSACFDSPPLERDTAIVGAPRLKLRLSADQRQAQIAVRLNHVHPDGASTRITYGVLNLSHRDGPSAPSPLVPGEGVEVEVSLDHIAYRVPQGHRLRVAISTSYWPLLWPAAQSAVVSLTGGDLALPVRNTGERDEWVFPPPDADLPWETETLREGGHVRRQETDLRTGLVSLVIEDDFGKLRDSAHGLVHGSVGRERWTIHPDDPLSARGWCHWTDELERDDIRLRTETRCEMWADADTFHLTATIEAYENGTRVHHREVHEEIPRDHI